MLGKMVSMGFRLYTLPIRAGYRRAASVFNLPADLDQFLTEVRTISDQVAQELQWAIETVDQEMNAKAAHLTPQQRDQAAQLAVHAAEQHLSMAAINLLRALWLSSGGQRSKNTQRLSDGHPGVVINHDE